MRKVFLLFGAFILVFGCATANQVYTPGGELGYHINCSGNGLNWGMCFEKAGAVCGDRGYVVIDRSGEVSGTTVFANQFGLYGGSMSHRSLIIKCREASKYWKKESRTSNEPVKNDLKLQLNKKTGEWELVRPKND